MDALKIMAVAVVGVMLSLVLKEQKQVTGILVSVCVCLCIFFIMLPYLEKVISYISVIYTSFDDKNIIGMLLRVTGIGILTAFSSDICRDAGFSSVASIVIFSGKAICMCVILPVIASFLSEILSIIP